MEHDTPPAPPPSSRMPLDHEDLDELEPVHEAPPNVHPIGRSPARRAIHPVGCGCPVHGNLPIPSPEDMAKEMMDQECRELFKNVFVAAVASGKTAQESEFMANDSFRRHFRPLPATGFGGVLLPPLRR